MVEDPIPKMIIEIEESEWTAFRTLWTFMEKRSYLSNLFLRDFYAGPYFLNCFAHVLNKKDWPHFRYYLGNIVLLTPGEHALLDQGTIEQRESYAKTVKMADWTRIALLRDKLKSEYQALFPTKRGLIIGMRYSNDEVRVVIRKLNAIFLNTLLSPLQPVEKHDKKKNKGGSHPDKKT